MSDQVRNELPVHPGMTASQRKEELDKHPRYIDIRNLAYIHYRRPDGKALMTYQESLDDRERTKLMVLLFEIEQGWLVNDIGLTAASIGTTAQAAPASAPAPMPAPQMQAAAPAPAPMPAPQMIMAQQPQPGMAPAYAMPQQMQAAPQAVPAPAPAQAAAAAAAEAPAATTSRPRRTKAQTQAAAAGVSVAPPPSGPSLMPSAPMQQMAAPQMAAPMQMAAPGQQMAPAPQQSFAPAAAIPTMPQQVPVGQPVTVDLTPIIQRLDDLGRGITAIARDVEVLKTTAPASVQVALNQALAALHHIYSTTPALAKSITDAKVSTLDDFRRYLASFTGNPT